MVLGLYIDLPILNDQVHSSGPMFSNQKKRVTMAGVVPAPIPLDGASIYTLLDLAFVLVDLVLWGGVWTPPQYRPFKLWFEFEVHLDQFLTRQGGGQRSKNLLILVDELSETGVEIHALHFLGNILLSVEVTLPFILLFYMPHRFGGQLILPVLAFLGIVEGVYQRGLRIGESHLFIILLGPNRGFPGPLEEVQAGPSLDTLSVSPQDLL